MNKKWWLKRPMDFTLFLTVLIMLALGLIMVLSASAPKSISETGNSYSYVKKQSLCACIGLIALYFVSKIDYRKYKKIPLWAYYVASLLLLLSVLVLGVSSKRSK